MSRDDLPLVHGIAVDDNKTNMRHQIANVKGNILQYSVYCPSIDNQIDKDFNENLLDVLSDKKALRTEQGMLHAVAMFGRFLSSLKPEKQTGFKLNEEVLALTYDIHVNKNYIVTDVQKNLTRAVMTEELTNGYADKRILVEPEHAILNPWYDMMYAQRAVEAGRITFEEVTKRTNRIIAKKLCVKTIENKIGCLYRLDYEGNRTEKDTVVTKGKKNVIGSTLNFNRDMKEYGNTLRLAMVPATASREYLDSINIISIAEYEQNGKHIFPAPLLKSIADFKNIKSTRIPKVFAA